VETIEIKGRQYDKEDIARVLLSEAFEEGSTFKKIQKDIAVATIAKQLEFVDGKIMPKEVDEFMNKRITVNMGMKMDPGIEGWLAKQLTKSNNINKNDLGKGAIPFFEGTR